MGSQLIRLRPTTLKKRRGVFYTPSEVSDLLARWAIRSPSDLALEPSFGGCNFLHSLHTRYKELGVTYPWQQVFGCDVSGGAFRTHLAKLIPLEADRKNFVKGDFLNLTPASFGSTSFQAALGNPPYVSYHNMYKVQRAAAASVGFDATFRVRQTGNLWTYFVFHTLRFLAPGGRMAWLLPSSLIQAEYGRVLLTELRRRFERVAIVSLHQKLFDSTDEKTEVLLCDRLGKSQSRSIEIANADDLEACRILLRDWETSGNGFASLPSRVLSSAIPRQRLAAYRRIGRDSQTVRLRDLAHLSIGVVTGANELFVVSEKIARENKIPNEALTPILGKFEIVPGLEAKTIDFGSARRKGLRCLLVDVSEVTIGPELRKYFAQIPLKQRKKNVTFKKRKDWRIPDAGKIPDAFLPYMHHNGPRLVLNGCKTNSTNTIHRVYFNQEVSLSQRRLIAISILSTFSQVSAEIEGRIYGSGVLKHELREAGSIQLIIPKMLSSEKISKTFKTINGLLRSGDRAGARRYSDRFLASVVPNLFSDISLRELGENLNYLRDRRHRNK